MPFSATELFKEADRELGLRRRVYPRMVDQAKMTNSAADRQIALMQQIRDDYKAKADAEAKAGELPL